MIVHSLGRFLGIFKLPNVIGGEMMSILGGHNCCAKAALTSSCWVSLGDFQEKSSLANVDTSDE